MRRDRDLDAGAGGKTNRHKTAIRSFRWRVASATLDRKSRRTRRSHRTAPAGRIADPAPHRAEGERVLAVPLRAERGRRQRRGAADGESRRASKARERGIDLRAEHEAVRQHDIVAALQALEEASLSWKASNG